MNEVPYEPPVHAPPVYDLQKHNKERAMPQSQAPDKTVIQPEEAEALTGIPVPDPPAVLIPSLDEIKVSVRARAEAADRDLASLRSARDRLAERIRLALVESVEAHRILHSLEPRATKSKKP